MREMPPTPASIEMLRSLISASPLDPILLGELQKAVEVGHPEQLVALENIYRLHYLKVQEFEVYQFRRVL